MSQRVQFGEVVDGYPVPVLNEREIRAAAGMLFLATLLSFLFILFRGNFIPIKFVIPAFLADLLIRVFVSPRFSPTLIAGRLIVGNQTPEYVAAKPKRLAWLIGIVLASTMFILMVVMNTYGPITGITCLVCLVFLFFEAAFGICLGCQLYRLVYREAPTLCPGEVCDVQARQEIQKTSPAQWLVLVAFAGLMVMATLTLARTLSAKPRPLFVGAAESAAASGAAPDSARAAAGVVRWIGGQHRAVHEGDFGAKVRIRDLAGRPHLFALGPLEGLLGEITVLDGRAVITTVEQGKVHATAGLDHGAAFLAWTYAGAWTSVEMPDSVRSMAQVENYLPAAIRSAGIGLEDPIAFRIEGAVDTLNYHILNRPADSPPTMEAHEKSKVHFALAAGPVHLVGFHSQHHRGEFTPGTSDIHVHFVSADTSLAGHVESFVLASGARLLLAIPSR